MADVTWTGNGDGTTWSDGGNWSQRPEAGDVVRITAAGGARPRVRLDVDVSVSGTLAVGEGAQLTVTSGSTLAADGALDIDGRLEVDRGAVVEGREGVAIDTGGTATVNSAGMLRVLGQTTPSRGVWRNAGTIQCRGGGFELGGALTNHGLLDTGVEARVLPGGRITNEGVLRVTVDTLTNAGRIDNDGTIECRGVILNAAGGEIHSSGRLTIHGQLRNEGRIDVQDDGALTNQGTLTNAAGALLQNWGGRVTNTARLVNRGRIANYEVFANIGETAHVTLGGEFENLPSYGYVMNWAGYIEIEAEGRLVNLDTVFNPGRVRVATGGAVVNKGRFEVKNGGRLENDGQVSNVGSAAVLVCARGVFTNDRTVSIEGRFSLEQRGTVNNRDVRDVDPAVFVVQERARVALTGDSRLNNGSILYNYGVIDIEDGSTLDNCKRTLGGAWEEAVLNDNGEINGSISHCP